MPTTLKESISREREKLTSLLSPLMYGLARDCARLMPDRDALEDRLAAALTDLNQCKHLYVLDADAVQITANITREGRDERHFGRDRRHRPYMQGILGSTDFRLSDAYISRNNKRPSLTAVQVIRDTEGKHLGFLGADYDLRELPGSSGVYQEPRAWRQIKGDPAIRGGLFLQQRATSQMDSQIDTVLSVMNELMTEHGVFHGKLHFSSNRATVWLVDDPFAYRLLTIDELIDPDICLAYPHRPYTDRAVVPPEQIMPILDMFRALRFADDTIYLRAGSLNIINGLVALNFSCDGSHYIPYDEFLGKGLDFWLGGLVGRP